MKKVYDVIIVGAGPVGIIYAYELSKEFTVLLIDSKNIPSRLKSWCVPYSWLKDAGFKEFATNSIYQIKMGSQKGRITEVGGPRRLRGVNIDDMKFYTSLITDIKANGGVLVAKTKIIDYQIQKQFVKLASKEKSFRGKLVLDCSGVDSIFIDKKNLKYEYYYNSYGIEYDGFKGEMNWSGLINLGEIKEGMVYINDVPVFKEKYIPWWFVISEKRLSLEKMRTLYKEALKSDYLRELTDGLNTGRELYGWIPAWELKSRSKDRILSLGDAGGIVPFQSGMTISLALKTLKRFAKRITDLLQEGKLDAENLEPVTRLNDIEELNFDLGKIFLMILKNMNPEEFELMHELVGKIDIEDFVTFYFNLSADLDVFARVLRSYIGVFSLTGFLKILNRDGFGEEIKIGKEIFRDLLNRIV